MDLTATAKELMFNEISEVLYKSTGRRQKKKSRRQAEVFSHAYSYTVAFDKSKPPFLLVKKRESLPKDMAAKGVSRHEMQTVSTKFISH